MLNFFVSVYQEQRGFTVDRVYAGLFVTSIEVRSIVIIFFSNVSLFFL